MTTLTDLHRAVQSTLASKRLGRPVFVRYLVQSLEQSEAAVGSLTLALAAVREWLEQPLARLYATGSLASGQIALTVEFRDGATALISWSRCPPRGDGVDLLVLGNHGAMYHDAGNAELWDEAPSTVEAATDPALRRAVERALGSGRPEPIAGEAKP